MRATLGVENEAFPDKIEADVKTVLVGLSLKGGNVTIPSAARNARRVA